MTALRQRIFDYCRWIVLVLVVALMAAASSGVFHSSAAPTEVVTTSPRLQRYPPEEFSGTIVAGSIAPMEGTTQFVVDRGKKTGDTFDQSQREQVTSRLEGAPSDQAALVVDGATLFFAGTYDAALRLFFVSRVGTQASPLPAPSPVAVAAPVAPADNVAVPVADNTSTDNTSTDNTSIDNTSVDNTEDNA